MKNIEKVIACFRELDFHFNIDNFEDRLIAQKIVCLLQLKGIDLGYPCDVYIRGPYSPVLTKDLYDNSEKISRFETGETLNERENDMVDRLNEFFGLSSSLLEIGATYGFLNRHLLFSHVDSLRELKRMKPFIPEPRISLGVSKAKQFFDVISDHQIDDMKREFKAWQEASFFD